VRADQTVREKHSNPFAAESVRAVFLVGFMGAGKTSVGRRLAQALNWSFRDLDDCIIEREGRSIAELFQEAGEQAFRRAEHAALRQVLADLSHGGCGVVALGGGAFAQEQNAKLLQGTEIATVFLDAAAEELWSRCSRQAFESGTERPLFKSMNQFRKLYESRRGSYLKAAVAVQTGGRSVDAIASQIAETLGLKSQTVG